MKIRCTVHILLDSPAVGKLMIEQRTNGENLQDLTNSSEQ